MTGSGQMIQDFRQSLNNPNLIQLFDHWLGWRGNRIMPRWHDIVPEQIPRLLPNVWAWRIDERGDARLRLAGEQIAAMVRVTTRGKTLADLYPRAYAREIRDEFAAVLGGPACCHAIGALDYAGTHAGPGQRLCLPYGDEDCTNQGILGISYHPGVAQLYETATTFSRLTGTKRFLQLGGDARV